MKISSLVESSTNSSLITRNIIWNLSGTLIPLIVAILVFPQLIVGLGEVRFGILGISWVIVGYFNLFDLGLSRALTKIVAEKIAKGYNDELPAVIWTALAIMGVMGIIGMITLALISPWIINDVLNIPPNIRTETIKAFYLLAISIPVIITTSALRGVLEAHQKFKVINVIRVPLGIFTFLGPLAILPFSNNISIIVGILVVGRFVLFFVYGYYCISIKPELLQFISIKLVLIKPLISFGGWLTVTNVVGPLMIYMDRFLIGSLISMTAVTYYLPSYELASKILFIPGAIMPVIFPALTMNLILNPRQANDMYNKSLKYIFIMLFPLILIIFTFANEGLHFWVGSDIANNSTLVLQILIIGVLINSLANVSFSIVQASGRPDLTAKLHLLELPLYIVLLLWLLPDYGIVGAAIAWTIRVLVDAIMLMLFTKNILGITSLIQIRLIFVILGVISLLATAFIIQGLGEKIIFMIIAIPILFILVWCLILGESERVIISSRLKYIFKVNKVT